MGMSGRRVSKSETREVRVTQDGDYIVLIERERFSNLYGARAYRWDETRISITPAELEKALATLKGEE